MFFSLFIFHVVVQFLLSFRNLTSALALAYYHKVYLTYCVTFVTAIVDGYSFGTDNKGVDYWKLYE